MLAVDTNILVYAHRREARHGEQAYEVPAGARRGRRPGRSRGRACYEF